MLDNLERVFAEPGLAVGVILGLAGMVTAIGISLGIVTIKSWRRLRESEGEQMIKLMMLEQGFSAEEIERVVLATSTHRRKHAQAPFPAARTCHRHKTQKAGASVSFN